jgi:hypothetical protein
MNRWNSLCGKREDATVKKIVAEMMGRNSTEDVSFEDTP